MSVLLFLVGVLEKKEEEIIKIWAVSRVLRSSGGTPRRSEGPCHGVACPRRSVAEKRIFPSSGLPQHSSATPRQSYCTRHGKCCVLFVLLFRYFEYLSIGLMRTL